MKIFFAPVMMLTAVFSAVAAVQLAVLTKNSYFITKAVFEILAAGAIIAASIGILASIAAFAFVAPVLIFAALVVKTGFDIFEAVTYGISASKTEDKQSDKYNQLKITAFHKARSAILSGLFAAATLTLALVAAPVVQIAVAGAVVGAFGVSVVVGIVSSIVTYVRLLRAKHRDKNLELQQQNTLNGPRNTTDLTTHFQEQKEELSSASCSSSSDYSDDCEETLSVVNPRPVSTYTSVSNNTTEQAFYSQRKFN